MKKIFKILRSAITRFRGLDCFTMAAAISFYAFISLIPLLFMVTAFTGFILGTRPDLLESVVEGVRIGLPYISEGVVSDLKGLVYNWQALGWLGFLTLIWSAELVLLAFEGSLSSVFEVEWGRGFILRRFKAIALLFVAILVIFASIGLTALAQLPWSWDVRILGYPVKGLTFTYLLPFLLVIAAVTATYKIFAGRQVALVHALGGSLVFTVLWEGAKHLFTWYISNFPLYNKFYGSLGALFILLLWIFYSVSIFLFGATMAAGAYTQSESRWTSKQ